MLRGTLDDFTPADIFKLLSFSKKTGRLELTRRAGMGRVFFRDGEVYYAESSLSREPLGQKLIRARALTESHLRQALDEHADSGERVGQILLREGWINNEQLEAAVKQQIEDAVFDLLRWELGDFEWEPNATLEPEVPISVSVENLIMEASRRLDELEIISRKVPSPQAVVAVAPTPPEGAVEINITPEEWRVLVLVDGTRSVETIANTIGLDEFQTMRIVHGMVSAGLIEVVGAEPGGPDDDGPPPPPPADAEIAPPPPPPPPHAFEEPAAEGAQEEASFEEPFEGLLDEAFEGSGATAFRTAEREPEAFEREAFAPSPETPEGAVVEETLYEAHPGDPGTDPAGAQSAPPEEWFADPDLSAALFDPPAPGEVVTEVPDQEVPAAPEEAAAVEEDTFAEELPDAGAGPAETAVEDADDEPDAGEPAGPTMISDDTLLEMPPSPPRTAPPPPPVAPVEGADRSAAVRELAELFDDDDPTDRPRRPVIRRVEAPDGLTKRRVEDDEQVTKSLISRLIEGVKGL